MRPTKLQTLRTRKTFVGSVVKKRKVDEGEVHALTVTRNTALCHTHWCCHSLIVVEVHGKHTTF